MLERLKFWQDDTAGHEEIAEGLHKLKDDGDAVILFPYDDGTFFLKKGYFDKNLIGGKGGYETPDDDKIVLDGDGEPKKDLFGTPLILAVDPTEHSSAVDPIKSYIAQKKNIGEYLKVDKKGNVIEAGPALEPAPDSELAEEDIGPEDSMVEEKAEELADRDPSPRVTKLDKMDEALAELEREGAIEKIYDLAPPATVTDTGEAYEIEEATHVAVDQSKATDMIPKTMSTTELNTALDKARMEEHDPGERAKWLMYGGISGFIGAGVLSTIFFLLFQFF